MNLAAPTRAEEMRAVEVLRIDRDTSAGQGLGVLVRKNADRLFLLRRVCAPVRREAKFGMLTHQPVPRPRRELIAPRGGRVRVLCEVVAAALLRADRRQVIAHPAAAGLRECRQVRCSLRCAERSKRRLRSGSLPLASTRAVASFRTFVVRSLCACVNRFSAPALSSPQGAERGIREPRSVRTSDRGVHRSKPARRALRDDRMRRGPSGSAGSREMPHLEATGADLAGARPTGAGKARAVASDNMSDRRRPEIRAGAPVEPQHPPAATRKPV